MAATLTSHKPILSTLSSSSSPSWSSRSWTYDVFLSFRGEDTRKNFTGHLYTALMEAGVNTFIDDDQLPRGENISKELMQAIQGSRISIIVCSRRYGDSGWCLEELVEIMECPSLSREGHNEKLYKVHLKGAPSSSHSLQLE